MIDYEERIKYLQELLDAGDWFCGDDDAILDEIAEYKRLLREDANV